MDVREKLVEMLNEAYFDYRHGKGEGDMIANFASFLVAHGVTVQEWIPVTERLPKLIPCRAGTAYSEAVNALTSDRKVITAIWDGTDWIGPFGYWDAVGEKITHWTPVPFPLPQLPKEVTEHETL